MQLQGALCNSNISAIAALAPPGNTLGAARGSREGRKRRVGIYKANEKKRSIKKILHLLKHLIFFAPFLTFYYYAFNVQTFCYAFAEHPLHRPSPAPSCSLAANPTQCAFIPFAPFPLPVIHAASCAVCSFRLGAFTHTPCPHVTCLACPCPPAPFVNRLLCSAAAKTNCSFWLCCNQSFCC